VQCDRLLSVDHLGVVDPSPRVLHPWSGVGEYGGQTRSGHEAILVDVPQLAFVEGIEAVSDAERVKHCVALGVLLDRLGQLPVLDRLVIHGDRQTGSQVNTSAVFSSG
jgi:hypothetical protein